MPNVRPGRAQAPAPAAGSAAIKLRDRAVEFRRARRHSALVRLLKIFFPVLSAGIVSLYILPSFLRVSIDGGKGTATIKAITIEAGSLKMLSPRMQGVNENNGVYDVIADSAVQQSKATDVMYLDKIRGKLTSEDGQVTVLTAPDGLYNSKAEEMTFNNGAVVTREPGLTATFKTAKVFMKQQLVISKTPVIVRLHESKIEAETMTLYSGEQRAVFEGNVRTHIERQQVADKKARDAKP